MSGTPRLLYLAFFFPPSRASGVYRSRAVANFFARSGWDVTVLAGPVAHFEETSGGLDTALSETVDPRVRVVRPGFDRSGLPRPEGHRAADPLERHGPFPEKYADWSRNAFHEGLRLHEEHPFDLVLATGNPFSAFAAAQSLSDSTGCPYVLDYRDSWTLDLFTNRPAFPPAHPAHRWEADFMASASAVAFVNTALRNWHAERYPDAAERMTVVPNGWDPDVLPRTGSTGPVEDGVVHYAYVGTVTAQQPVMRMAAGFRELRRRTDSFTPRLHLHGHLGYFADNAEKLQRKLGIGPFLSEDEPDPRLIAYEGPVSKTAVGQVYDRSDVLVFLAGGSRYVTSGKIFEYMATGKPIVSVHKDRSAAEEYLERYPLWFKPKSLEAHHVAEALALAGEAARRPDPGLAETAREYAARFTRDRAVESLERHCAQLVGGPRQGPDGASVIHCGEPAPGLTEPAATTMRPVGASPLGSSAYSASPPAGAHERHTMSKKQNATMPGRILMLVDNFIDGDSRVQKAAKSMAEAGWDVHLVGRSPSNTWEHYDLGQARVHRLPFRALPPHATLRRGLAKFRYPFARNSIAVAKRRLELVEIDAGELAQRRMEAGDPRVERRRLREPRLPLAIFAKAVKVRQRWLHLRLRQTEQKLEWQRGRFKGVPENIETAFWSLLLRDRAWRKLDLRPLHYELSYAKFIDKMKPDLIHAHDFRMIGVAARSVARARARGRSVKMVYDAHEFVPGLPSPGPKWLKSTIAYEREYLKFADAVVTVSPALAEMLVKTHRLPETPVVTLNAPPKPTGETREDAASFGDVRSACGLPSGVPLMVYCGGASPQRGLHTMVESLAHLPQVHAAFVINTLDSPYVESLLEQAGELQVADRVHLMPYVPYDVLVGFLSTADVGIHPLTTGPVNHEVALATKFFEFMQAGLPMVVSNVKAMSAEVRRLGMGEVFESEDGKDLARAVGAVLDGRETYTQAYADPERLAPYTWEAQAEKYVELYRRLLMPERRS